MKKILGLDIGTNSIGWSFIELDTENEKGRILGIGSRIVPMDTDLLNNLEQGNSISKTANRRQARGVRRLKNRYKIRRNRLIQTLKIIGWLPEEFKIGSRIPYSYKVLSELKEEFNSNEISNDWAVYYLRKKALYERIELDELARILLHINQRRGFKSNRKSNNEELQFDAPEANNNLKWVEIARVVSIIQTGEKFKDKNEFEVEFMDGRKGHTYRNTFPDWINQDMELEFRLRKSKSGDTLTISLPNKTEWVQIKEALAKDFDAKKMHVGEYYFHELLKDRNYKIRERIVERKRIINELETIWQQQIKFHPELESKEFLSILANALYVNNENKKREIEANNLFHIITNNIIFYQRPLKSQKSSISECRLEKRSYFDPITKNILTNGIKVCPISKPIFQEFRIWKTISNIRIVSLKSEENGIVKADLDQTDQYLIPNRENLFELFDRKDKIKVKDILKELGLSEKTHRLNYPDETEFPGNETKYIFKKLFNKFNFDGTIILNDTDQLEFLWHCVYSIEDDHAIYNSVKKKLQLPEIICHAISKLPPFKLNYAAFSSKAISRLLPLMRTGKYWNIDSIDVKVKDRIDKIMQGEFDPNINDITREQLFHLKDLSQFNGLAEHLATYTVYGIHSELNKGEPVSSPDQIKNDIKHNSLRNPIVEQLLNETLLLVKAVWKQIERPDEIRIELAREFKKTAPERKSMYSKNLQNKEEKERIKIILSELGIGNPNSLVDIEKLRIAEENAKYNGYDPDKKPFFKKQSEPSKGEIEKYRLWMDQNCISPYTGKTISLGALFTAEYQIEHIIPKSKYFDDSFQNKVIVEDWANKEKDNYTALQYIRKGTQKNGKSLLTPEEYIMHIERTFYGKKRKLLLSDEIPQGFIERQLNDTRYISKKVQEMLFQITPNVYSSIGSITDELKQKWGLSSVMKNLMKERFERIENITGEQYVSYNHGENGERFLQLKGYEKRIDHRHHALDALVISCTTQSHIQYLNTLEAKSANASLNFQFQKILNSSKIRDFKKPWNEFHSEVVKALQEIVISYKNKIKIINKPKNKYQKFIKNEKGQWVKTKVSQVNSSTENPWISIRQALHKETIAGIVKTREYKWVSYKDALACSDYIANKDIKNTFKSILNQNNFNEAESLKYLKKNPIINNQGIELTKIQIWYMAEYAKNRVALDKSFKFDKIDKIAEYNTLKENKGLKNILKNHLIKNDNDPSKAFEGEGLEALAKSYGKQITKVTLMEPIGNKFEIRPGQYVEAAKGTNLFFRVYENVETKEREFETLGFKDVVERLKFNLPLVDRKDGYRWFTLSPNDLVYVPEPDEDLKIIDWKNDKSKINKRIYKMVSCSGPQCFFIPHMISKPIIETKELGANNKSEKSWDELMIKKVCVKLKTDRLGNIMPAL